MNAWKTLAKSRAALLQVPYKDVASLFLTTRILNFYCVGVNWNTGFEASKYKENCLFKINF